MKIPRLPLFILLILLAGLLSGCAGGTGVATSWPGLTVNDGTAYVAYNTFVYAVDVEAGTEVWRFPDEADNAVQFFAAPAITEDGRVLAGSYNNRLYSLDAETGDPADQGWPFQGAGRFVASPLAAAGTVFAPTAAEVMYALDAETGEVLWTFETEEAQWSTPVTNGELVYLPSMGHRVFAIDPQTEELVWSTEDLGGAIVGSPVLEDGRLFIGTFAQQVLALDAATGEVIDRYDTNGWVWSAPALVDGRLYFGDLQGYVYALDAADLSEIWVVNPEEELKPAVAETPLVMNGSVYFATESGNFYALDAETGEVRWTQLLGGRLFSAPAATQDGAAILVAPAEGDARLVALNPDSGAVLWRFVPAED